MHLVLTDRDLLSHAKVGYAAKLPSVERCGRWGIPYLPHQANSRPPPVRCFSFHHVHSSIVESSLSDAPCIGVARARHDN
jgi:hypothetical protein